MDQLEDIPFRVCTSIVPMISFIFLVRKSLNYLISNEIQRISKNR
jgi:hypothetical protein